MKSYIAGVIIAISLGSLIGCDNKERLALQQQVDSLNVELASSQEMETKLNDIDLLIDSIDASRKSLEINMSEGGQYRDQVARLNEINKYVKKTEAKIDELESTAKRASNASAASIRRLKADLKLRSDEIVTLQDQLATAQNENSTLVAKVQEKDSILTAKEQMIETKTGDIASLEKVIEDTQLENKMTVANLYFEQAQALEMAADRTQFAPRKKREARQEAMELYKLSLSLGKTEAEEKISELEKTI